MSKKGQIRAMVGFMKAVADSQQAQAKMDRMLYQHSEKYRQQKKMEQEKGQMDLANKQEMKRWENQPENMSPTDKMAFENQQLLKRQYEGQGAQPTRPAVGAGDIAASITAKNTQEPPPEKIRRVAINSKGEFIEKEENNPDYFVWQKKTEENIKNAPALERQGEQIKSQAQDTLDTIQEVKNGIKYFGAAGPIPTLNPWGYDRKRWEAEVNKLLSGRIVNLMNEMKQASKTGATGFGQLNQSELRLLKEASTALNRGLSPKDAMGYLSKMEGAMNKITGGEQAPTENNAQSNAPGDIRAQYNALRGQGLSAAQVRAQLGL